MQQGLITSCQQAHAAPLPSATLASRVSGGRGVRLLRPQELSCCVTPPRATPCPCSDPSEADPAEMLPQHWEEWDDWGRRAHMEKQVWRDQQQAEWEHDQDEVGR